MRTYACLALAWLVLAACDQRRSIGELDPNRTNPNGTGEVQFQNLTARIAGRYDCPAGRVGNVDDAASCSCDTSPGCDVTGTFPSDCLCDAECVDMRPAIECADYAFTFSLANGNKPIDRMTEVKLTLGELEVFEGGLDCDAWSLSPGETSDVLEIGFRYDSGSHYRFATPSLSYPCKAASEVPKPRDGSSESDLGEPLPPALLSGAVMIELRGLYTDASPWKLEAAATLD